MAKRTGNVSAGTSAFAMETPVVVMETAGEGGAWKMALLAAYIGHTDMSLTDFLQKKIFSQSKMKEVVPTQRDMEGYARFMKRYKAGLEAEKQAVEYMHKY